MHTADVLPRFEAGRQSHFCILGSSGYLPTGIHCSSVHCSPLDSAATQGLLQPSRSALPVGSYHLDSASAFVEKFVERRICKVYSDNYFLCNVCILYGLSNGIKQVGAAFRIG